LTSTSGANGEPRRVLVVDDNADAATLLSVLLEAHGHQVRVAHDAEDALVTQASFAADVALLDIGLPDINGYDLARQLRASATRPLRLIAVTGWGQDGDRERARAAGFDGHLTKPAQLETLLAVLSVPSRNDAENI
jgi:CheY-like chemotaxis protein